MTFNEEKDEDFIKVMTEALRQRREAAVMRMEFSGPSGMRDVLAKKFQLGEAPIFEVTAWMDLKGISQLAFQPGSDEPQAQSLPMPHPVADFESTDDIWELLKSKNLLVTLPYESFDVVNRFLSAAADDPDVLAIKRDALPDRQRIRR